MDGEAGFRTNTTQMELELGLSLAISQNFYHIGTTSTPSISSGVISHTLLGLLWNALDSTHVVEQLLFSIVPSIQTFDFDLILGSFFYFLEP